jgi:hypothetical protein
MKQTINSHHFFAHPPYLMVAWKANVSHGLLLLLLTVCPSGLNIYQDLCNMQTAAGADFGLGRSMVRRSDAPRVGWKGRAIGFPSKRSES